MAVKIRLMRIGTNRRPFYRIVAVDERKKRTGGYLELLGTYNPLTEPKEINLEQAKIDAWIKKGAVPSYGFLRIIGKAPQRAPRKPKKPARNALPGDAGGAPKEISAASSEPAAEAAAPEAAEDKTAVTEEKTEEIKTEATPSEETAETPAAAAPTEEKAEEKTDS